MDETIKRIQKVNNGRCFISVSNDSDGKWVIQVGREGIFINTSLRKGINEAYKYFLKIEKEILEKNK